MSLEEEIGVLRLRVSRLSDDLCEGVNLRLHALALAGGFGFLIGATAMWAVQRWLGGWK